MCDVVRIGEAGVKLTGSYHSSSSSDQHGESVVHGSGATISDRSRGSERTSYNRSSSCPFLPLASSYGHSRIASANAVEAGPRVRREGDSGSSNSAVDPTQRSQHPTVAVTVERVGQRSGNVVEGIIHLR